MQEKFRQGLCLWLVLAILAALVLGGCSPYESMKKWLGYDRSDELAEETAPPEAVQETVMIDGKPYVRSRNPYYLTYPEQDEYIYVEKGREFVGAQELLIRALARAIGKEKAKAAGKTIPPDKLRELVRAEVDRILKEQGLGGFLSKTAGGKELGPYVGRAVAVIPNPETPRSYEGLNRMLAVSLGGALGRTKDIKVSDLEQVKAALGKAGLTGKLALKPNIQALGDFLGVQGIVLTNIIPPEKGSTGFMVLEVYDTFGGNKEKSIVGPAGPEGLKPLTIEKFARDNALRVGGELINIPWFGRVEFVKEGKVYLSLGQTSGLKVGDRLKVVTPGKEVINPATHASLGYTSDIVQGELKVTELLGASGAVASVLNGGPFKANDKIKAR